MASKITNVWEVLGHETKWKARLSCGHEVWLTMKERPGLGQEVPCPTCQPTMAAKWYEPGLERTLDALETADCRAAAREVLTRELERLAAAQPPRIVRNLTMEDAEEIDKILERHKTDEFDSFNAADALNDFLFGGVNYPGIFKDPAAQPRLTKERIENVIRTILVNRHVDVEGAVEFAKNALVPQPATQFTQPTIETFSEPQNREYVVMPAPDTLEQPDERPAPETWATPAPSEPPAPGIVATGGPQQTISNPTPIM